MAQKPGFREPRKNCQEARCRIKDRILPTQYIHCVAAAVTPKYA
jgi:hypothetical protein